MVEQSAQRQICLRKKIMSGISTTQFSKYNARVAQNRATSEPTWVRWTFIAITLLFLSLFLFMPLAAVFTEALRKGFDTYITALTDSDALSSIKLTVIAALIAVPLPLIKPVTLVPSVIAGVVVAVATLPTKPFALVTLVDVTVPPPPETVAKLNTPLPFVCKTCPFVPSAIGKVRFRLAVFAPVFKEV